VVAIDLQGRTALVTGASRGIGWAIAVRLAAEAGARVVVHYRSDHQGAEATVDAVTRFSEWHAVSADLTDAREIEAMFASSAPYGAVDILVINAGIYPSAALEEMKSAEWAEL
jgi:NAD(P)-dependent dehydrogenase (short-subunit alcohol dehydrogenase family)